MKVNELRIGNLIEYRIQDDLDDRKDWWEVSKIDATDLCILESNIDYDFRPIPLTEEWLLKLGFEYDKEYDIYFIDDFAIRGKDFVLCDIDIEVKFEYVHRLQNSYFELKNKELCYNFVITK